MEPTTNGFEMTWPMVGVTAGGQTRLVLALAVGAGVTEGEYTNRAYAVSGTDPTVGYSGEASATVRVVPDPTFDCTDVLGKVFDDKDRNGMQEKGERGLAGVRLVTARGLVATTDAHGRFHITCAIVPREDRGSNFVLKLDDRSLPTGYRMTTRQVQVQRATRGKALPFHFGAAIMRVVGVDLADPVFEPNTTVMREQWKPRIPLLIEELLKGEAILRLSYLADVEDAALVQERLAVVKKEIGDAWAAQNRGPLTIETEVFWRRGAPPAGGATSASLIESLLPSVDAGPPLPSVDAGPPLLESTPGSAVERQMPGDTPFTTWSQDPEQLHKQIGDKIEKREVTKEQAKIVKLKNVVPPIRFESGVADIPASTIAKLRSILDSMRDLPNVRLHLVGHADTQPLSPALEGVFGDNQGLSRERAGEVAEFIQTALALPPEAISFDWAGDTQ
ncbi:MAG: OmpA family protein, partial [Myxococcota bacterium]